MAKESMDRVPTIANVVFKESINFRGSVSSNYKQGLYNGTVRMDKAGVVIELPEAIMPNGIRSDAYSIMVPLSNIRQIDFVTEGAI